MITMICNGSGLRCYLSPISDEVQSFPYYLIHYVYNLNNFCNHAFFHVNAIDIAPSNEYY